MTNSRARIAHGSPYTEKGRCGWCSATLAGRRTRWCSDACVNEWLIRHNPGWAASRVYQRDHGVCALCRVDTKRQREAFRRLLHWGKRRWTGGWTSQGKTSYQPSYTDVRTRASQKYGIPYSRLGGSWWDCDHIVPVAEGGGACGLNNLRTLCIPCHQGETKRLARRLADNRKGQQPLDLGGAT